MIVIATIAMCLSLQLFTCNLVHPVSPTRTFGGRQRQQRQKNRFQRRRPAVPSGAEPLHGVLQKKEICISGEQYRARSGPVKSTAGNKKRPYCYR